MKLVMNGEKSRVLVGFTNAVWRATEEILYSGGERAENWRNSLKRIDYVDYCNLEYEVVASLMKVHRRIMKEYRKGVDVDCIAAAEKFQNDLIDWLYLIREVTGVFNKEKVA